jgi:short-subunit dehydrogenase involved in D-alanine esterification of teichoic acids
MGPAAAFHARGATVIIAGRTRSSLEAVVAKHSGMQIEEIDAAIASAIAEHHEAVAHPRAWISQLFGAYGLPQGAGPEEAPRQTLRLP